MYPVRCHLRVAGRLGEDVSQGQAQATPEEIIRQAAIERLGPGYRPSSDLQSVIARGMGGAEKAIKSVAQTQAMTQLGVGLGIAAMPVWGQVTAGVLVVAQKVFGGKCQSKIAGIVKTRTDELQAYGQARMQALEAATKEAADYVAGTARTMAGSKQPLGLDNRDFSEVFAIRSRFVVPLVDFSKIEGLGGLNPFECDTAATRRKMDQAVKEAKQMINDAVDPVIEETRKPGFRAFLAKIMAIQLRWNTPEFYPFAVAFDGAPKDGLPTAASGAKSKTALIVGGGAAAALLALVAAR